MEKHEWKLERVPLDFLVSRLQGIEHDGWEVVAIFPDPDPPQEAVGNLVVVARRRPAQRGF